MFIAFLKTLTLYQVFFDNDRFKILYDATVVSFICCKL
ncbi:hypothetical protein T01_12347 [Trichinella spiralis]|uniref:Uncharacterized protein n=1 Tax=Trichinella spiralis TaxID=6334 RepID=A0A0V0YYN4_TRISP|nr:hypothetical protein T01_12347 [Trichinella spiralis]